MKEPDWKSIAIKATGRVVELQVRLCRMANQVEKLSWMVQESFESSSDSMYTVEDCEEAWLARER